jgi:hypothetical protein
MDLDDLKADLREIKADVKELMMFMAVEQAKNKKSSMVTSGVISLIVAVLTMVLGRFLI